MKGAFSAGILKWGVIAAAKADEKKKLRRYLRARQKPTGSINAINSEKTAVPHNAAVAHDIAKTKTDGVYKKTVKNKTPQKRRVFGVCDIPISSM